MRSFGLARSSIPLGLFLLGGCTDLLHGMHQLTDYRAKYGARAQGLKAADIHGAAIMDGLRSPQGRSPEVASQDCSMALTISGGGSISAAFAYGALREIASWDDVTLGGKPASILSHVDYISTASGGGITGAVLAGTFWESDVEAALDRRPYDAGAFNAALRGHLDSPDYKATFSEVYLQQREFLWTDGQSRLKRFRERLPLGVFGRNYQAKNCQEAITFDDMFSPGVAAAQATRSGVLKETFARAQAYAPVWIPNATSFADGTRVPLTPAVLAKLKVNGITQDALCEAKTVMDWPMSEPLAASMSFPGIGPYRFKSDLGVLDLVDGGLADNLGVYTALDVVRADLASANNGRRAKRAFVLVLDSSNDAESGMFTDATTAVPKDEYLMEYGLTELYAQYPAAAEALDAARPAISNVFVQARDFRDDPTPMEICRDLTPAGGKVPGASGCAKGAADPTTRQAFIREQRTSAAIDYGHADGLMQVGRVAARAAKPAIVEAFRRCVLGDDAGAASAGGAHGG